MYADLMDRPDEIIAHESFFMDFFNAFEDLLFAKLVKSDEYEIKSKQFLIYWGNMHDYYYGQVTIPSEFYDKEVIKEITSKLAGGFNG